MFLVISSLIGVLCLSLILFSFISSYRVKKNIVILPVTVFFVGLSSISVVVSLTGYFLLFSSLFR